MNQSNRNADLGLREGDLIKGGKHILVAYKNEAQGGGGLSGVVQVVRWARLHPGNFGPDADKAAFLVDGFVGDPGMITTARRQYPNQYLHYHRAGHGIITSPSAKRGYIAFVMAKISRLQGLPEFTSAPWATARWKAKTRTK